MTRSPLRGTTLRPAATRSPRCGGGDPDQAIETIPAPDPNGTTDLDTAGWDPGSYEAVLSDADAEVARVPFYLRDPGAQLDLSTNKQSYAKGEPIEVSWTGGPANRWDWLGVYPADDSTRRG